VAAKNLGELPALIVAAALMTEYVLTVAVSSSSGVAAITSAVTALAHDAVPLGLAVIAILLAGNPRGAREAGAIFSAPAYAFRAGHLRVDRGRGRCFRDAGCPVAESGALPRSPAAAGSARRRAHAA
jgi:hypothetical protein